MREESTTQKYVVGAYPASPAHKVWHPELESEFLNALARDPRIWALELPWLGSLHPHDDEWLMSNFPSHIKAIYTDIPFVMAKLSKNSNYGLASPNSSGRQEALQDLASLSQSIAVFNDKIGANSVHTVELHTAPQGKVSVSALVNSLQDLATWDWSGARLVIEHCDAWIKGQDPEKGFLTLDDEIEAINTSGIDCGLSINWGRSAIELRDSTKVVNHIARAKEAHLLRGIIFSGASAKSGDFGGAWADGHHPFKKSSRNIFGDSDSLLGPTELRNALAVAGEIDWLGAKVSWPNSRTGTVQERITLITQTLDLIDDARAK